MFEQEDGLIAPRYLSPTTLKCIHPVQPSLQRLSSFIDDVASFAIERQGALAYIGCWRLRGVRRQRLLPNIDRDRITFSTRRKIMKAAEALAQVDPQKWDRTSAIERLHLLEQVREKMEVYADELAASDSQMKNDLLGEALFSDPVSMVGTVVPMANTITACIDLYEALVDSDLPQPISITKVENTLPGEVRYDIHVFPQNKKDKLLYSDRKDFIRVIGEPKQINPLEKPAGIIAVLGAGNYSSSLEMVKV